MRRTEMGRSAMVVAAILTAAPAHAASIFLSDTTSPSHADVYAIDASSAGSFSLGIWVVPDTGQTLDRVDLNLRVEDVIGTGGIDLTGATVHNPANASSQRWHANEGTGVDSVTADLITGMIGATTTGTGAPGEGSGIDDTNSESDPGFDAATGAYLFATVDYNITTANDAANLWLQISDEGIGDTTDLDTAVIFGLADASLDASDLGDRNVDQQAPGNDIADASSGTDIGDGWCDTNHDSVCNAADLDFIASEFGNAPTLGADVNGDGTVSRIDVTTLVTNPLGPTGFGTTYGDANLDQSVDIADFNIFLTCSTHGGPDWANGDWNGDGSCDIADFNILLTTTAPTDPAPASATAVPEPTAAVLLLAGLLGLGWRRRGRGQQ